MKNITKALKTLLFDKDHRIVFWYDAKQELYDDYQEIDIPNVEKREINNNEFSLKYEILREQPKQKFILYKHGPEPTHLDNWLLDVQLAHTEFRTDRVGIWLSELGLGRELVSIVQDHTGFYEAAKRTTALAQLIDHKQDSKNAIRLKMLAVCADSDPRLDAILESLLAELAEDKSEKIGLIGRCHLDTFLWQKAKQIYGYTSDTPSIQDFVIELFKSCYAMETEGSANLSANLNGDALVFLKRWKDSRQFERDFEYHSKYCANFLNIEEDVRDHDFQTLLEVDYFRLIDQKIISDLVQAVALKTVSSGSVTLWIRQRRQSRWYSDFAHLYSAIDYAAQFISAAGEATLTIPSLAEGIGQYATTWFRIDQLYRKFIFHVRASSQATLMETLSEQIENLYSNSYLLKLNDSWQPLVDTTERWTASPIQLQKNFFRHWVQPFLDRGKKVCVIISDAMRYEIGEEFASRIRQENRYEAKVEPALSMLPSYTQLGMAALLPNQTLTLSANKTGTVKVDGQSSQGSKNRLKILENNIKDPATLIKAEQLIKLNREDSRTLFRDHSVVYVYHNRIDAVGDKRDSEERVFEAAEETCQELIQLVKKLTNANATNLIVTADHGFIYQHRAIAESDFSNAEVEGEQVTLRDRRFSLGKGLTATPGLRKFSSSSVGLAGDLEIQIPKSINRLRLKGSGSRFVHGGATLQEVVIPVVSVNKKRHSDLSAVDVDIISGGNRTITTGQLAVAFYQAQPTTAKVQSRILRAGIYNQKNELISDSHELTFDFTTDNPRERELKIRFLLTSQADAANSQTVKLRLEEKLPGTSQYREYKSETYTIRRSFTSDFDF
ncbi:BREX-1 system phosphatase PglZ type A [cf. Phormidesmis sp. LEGE 11477]|uniref:BREX-1 system phosphatase PglZ type A n=1 Tax=cf. Phormidesmis sp. LEGE 11477 TaxID=1828680 RepID=UPI001880C1B5|nr:BREX-1 system phosphatase PglZ type A [cf. Phormidesmis sp. LEGE 11477]MBE9064138.1 BREX-1 system phosphatase PglZ type A [cf. Phormidesmis sp. LEGE 11477]